MDKVRFSREATVTDGEDDAEDEDEYSASACAIMQRRASSRRGSRRRSRRPSSPFPQDLEAAQAALGRRRSSVFTTSSGDTAVTVDDGAGQDQVYERMRLHQEVLGNVKYQPWQVRRKVRLVQQAKAYIKRHEGELQERLAQGRTTRDLLERFNIELGKRWQQTKREMANFVTLLIPWELRIKEIECHFGSVVASYFTFLRWMFWVNLVITVMLVAFVIIPEVLTADKNSAGVRKIMLPEDEAKSTNLMTLWNFEGILKYSPIFYGYYTDRIDYNNGKGYRLPFAYFMTGLAVYTYSFVAILRRQDRDTRQVRSWLAALHDHGLHAPCHVPPLIMAKNSRMSKLSEKGDECIFTWKLFTGWDYMIGNSETAHNRTASIILGFKEALLEEAERKRNSRNWKVISLRVLVNLTVVMLLVASAYLVVDVVNRSTEPGDTWWGQNETTVIMTFVSFVFPIIFELIGMLECYHPRKQLRVQLARIMVLNLLNLYSLIFAQFGNISKMTEQLEKLKGHMSTTPQTQTTASTATQPTRQAPTDSGCSSIAVNCSVSRGVSPSVALAAMLLVGGATTVSRPPALALLGGEGALPTDAPPVSIAATMGETVPFVDTSAATGPSIQTQIHEVMTENTDQYSDITTDTVGYPISSMLDTSSTVYIPSLINITGETNLSSITNGNYEDIFNLTVDDATNITELLPETTTYEFSASSGLTDQNTDNKMSNSVTFTDSSDYEVTSPTSTSVPATSLDSETVSYTQAHIANTATTQVEGEMNEICYITVCGDGSGESRRTESSSPSSKPIDKAITSVPAGSPGNGLDVQFQDMEFRRNLSRLCWETMFGQELVKLTVMDLVMTIISTLMMDFFRALLVRFLNRLWCWDLEKQFPQYGDFKIAENILHLVNNQGMVWMGMFFSPGLPLINTVKLAIMMYLRSWATLTSNVPHEVVFRASRSNNFYFALLLTMLFLCVLPVGYAIVWVEPSWHCGPFSGYRRMYHLFTETLQKALPESLQLPLAYVSSPGIVIPLLVLLVLIIYYLASLTGALREANNDLKMQLRRERTEERRKMFQLVGRRQRGADTPFGRWRRVLPELQARERSGADKGPASPANGLVRSDAGASELMARLVKRALRESSATSDEDGEPGRPGAGAGDDDDLPPLRAIRPVLRAAAERQDSLSSCWSGDIPEIRISGAERAQSQDPP